MNWSGLREMPASPGVYIFKDSVGAPLYVGMAGNLRKRVHSYTRESVSNKNEEKKIQEIQANATCVEYILADNLLNAKIMEDWLIYQLRPPLNGVMLPIKYNYLKVTCNEKFPRLIHTKDICDDGGVYFGPFHSFSRSKDVVFDLRRIFKLRDCDGSLPGGKDECLNRQVGHCLGPCQFESERLTSISEQYHQNITDLLRVLSGDIKPLLEKFAKKMEQASSELDFETAGIYLKKQERILYTLGRKKMRLLGPADLRSILQQAERYVTQSVQSRRCRSGYSRWE